MARLALKVDVDTWRGTREGVPRLAETLRCHGAGATFFWSLGPDHTGRAIRRVFRPGFVRKVSRTSVLAHYGMRTLLYGTLLPGPDIGQREASLMRAVRDAGFECGIHTWDHTRWQDQAVNQTPLWIRAEMRKAADRFTQVFGQAPRAHGAAGWQMSDAAYLYEAEMGLDYASDVRGTCPFQPVDVSGEPIGVPQLPTTLPTLDELLGCDDCTADNVHEHLLARTVRPTDHVYTLHAELEGMRLLPVFERLLSGWRTQGYELASCRSLFESLDPAALPRHRPVLGEVSGRSGLLARQGAAIG